MKLPAEAKTEIVKHKRRKLEKDESIIFVFVVYSEGLPCLRRLG